MGKKFVLAAALAAAAVQGVAAQDSDLHWARMHGWLMWTSFGFLFPLGVILIRYSRPQGNPDAVLSFGRVSLLFRLHMFVTSLAVVSATAGFVVLVRRDGGSWNFTHQRLGLALMIIMWGMPFIGICRPPKGHWIRPAWFVVHWVFGTGAVILGIVNCYIGVNAFQFIFKESLRTLNIAFSCQLAFIAVLYFVQDKWYYILGQRNVPNSHAVKPSQTIGLQSL